MNLTEEQLKSAIDCAKACVIDPATERLIGKIYELLKRRDEVALKYAQALRLPDKSNYAIEMYAVNMQIKNLLKID